MLSYFCKVQFFLNIFPSNVFLEHLLVSSKRVKIGFDFNRKGETELKYILIESSSKNLPNITEIRPYLAFYLLKFTKDLPKIYQVYQTLTKSYKIFFQFTKDLPTIYQKCLDKNILILLYIFSQNFLATVN